MTRSETHSLKLTCFQDFLLKLMKSEASFEIASLEIVYLIDVDKVSKFKIPERKVIGDGLLAAFPDWQQGKEVEKVKVVGIESTTFF